MKSLRFEELLERDGKLIYKTKGRSMKPMLQENRDLVVIRPPEGSLKSGDVALYRRGEQYVLHRVLPVLPIYRLARVVKEHRTSYRKELKELWKYREP